SHCLIPGPPASFRIPDLTVAVSENLEWRWLVCGGRPASPAAARAQAVKAMGADDQVVEHLDPEQAAGFAQVAGHRPVLGAWSRVPRRVAVRQHDRRGIVPQGRLEDVARLQGGDVEAAERDRLT